MNENTLTVSPSPHLHTNRTTSKIMLDVIIALIPSVIASVVLFGARALAVIAVSVASSVLSEYIFNLITKKKQTITDLSAAVTGLILACSLPSSMPLWQTALGAVFATAFVKSCFGGIGHNFANPAITARIMLLLAFTDKMAEYSYPVFLPDATSGATPLVMISEKSKELPKLTDMLFGIHGGSLGETCILAILLGFIYLCAKKVISWHTPVSFVGSVFLLSLLLEKGSITNALMWTMGGSVVFGAVFMATDYATTPRTKSGKIVFGIGCGVITFAIRAWGSYPEGVSFAILFMNILTPYIEMLTKKKPFGVSNIKKKAEGGEIK